MSSGLMADKQSFVWAHFEGYNHTCMLKGAVHDLSG